jgi:mRNA interferase MazF
VTLLPQRGELWWCEQPEIGRRPMVVLSRDSAIPRLRRVVVAPCSTRVRGLETEVVLEPGDDPVAERTAVHLDSVHNLSVGHFVDRMGRLSELRLRQVCAALAIAVDCTY